MLAFRAVVSMLLRELRDFSLHTLKAGPAGGPPAAAVLGRQYHDGSRVRAAAVPSDVVDLYEVGLRK
jgi:hypothetical protein